MSDESQSNLPASQEPTFAPPAERQQVDLSDLQAELDASRRDAELDELVGAEMDARDRRAAAEDKPDRGAGQDEDPHRGNGKRSRAARYRDRINSQREEIERLQASLDALSDAEVEAELDPADPRDYDDDVSDHGGDDDPAAEHGDVRAALHRENGHHPQNGHARNGHQAPQPLSSHDLQRMSMAELEAYADQELARDAEERRQTQILREQDRIIQNRARNERIREWRSRGADPLEQRKNSLSYDEALRKSAGLHVHPEIAGVLAYHERLPALFEYLANRPKELHAINKAAVESPAKAGAMLGALAERAMKYDQPKIFSKAPPPSRSPKGGAAPYSPEAEIDAYIRKKYPNSNRS